MEQQLDAAMPVRRPWNKGRIIGQKPPLKPQDIWSIRVMLRMKNRFRDLALFNLAIDSKLRACDLVKLRTTDVLHGSSFLPRASVVQQKTGQPVRFEITEPTRAALQQWIDDAGLRGETWLFPVGPSRVLTSRLDSMLESSKAGSRWSDSIPPPTGPTPYGARKPA